MKNIFSNTFFICFLSLADYSFAQFNNYYFTEDEAFTRSYSIELGTVADNYVVPTIYVPWNGDMKVIKMLEIDSEGMVLSSNNAVDLDMTLLGARHQSFFDLSDNGYIYAAGKNGPFIIKFNSNLEIEWQLFDETGPGDAYSAGEELFDGSLIMAYSDQSRPDNILPMRRLSAGGEILSEFEIELDYDYGYVQSLLVKDSLVFISFHRFLIGEYRRNYIVCYNAFTGEEIWETHQIEDEIRLAYIDPILLWSETGDLLLVYHQLEELALSSTFDTGYWGQTMLSIIETNTGELNPSETLGNYEFNTWMWDAVATFDGGIVLLSQGFEDSSLNVFGMRMLKTNSENQEEWFHLYLPPELNASADGNKWLMDVEITPDDGIIAAGLSDGSLPGFTGEWQYPWVLKVDACGNEMVSDCALSGVGDLALNNTIAIYPNPARDRIYLKGKDPIKHVSIFDLQGKMVHNESFSGSLEQTLFIDHLQPGLYLVQATNQSGAISTSKISVKR
jgi:hypothetical protein